jgi:hypothetical protein
MCRELKFLGLIMLCATIGAPWAAAQSTVDLNMSSSGTVMFIGGPTSTNMTVTPTTGSVSVPTGFLSTATAYTVSGGPLTISPALGPTGLYGIASTLNFALNGVNSLSGTLSFTDGFLNKLTDRFVMDADLVINPSSAICVTDPGVCAAGADNTVQFTLAINKDFGRFFSGNLSLGPVSGIVTPEPGTMLLFGTGLLALGGLLRRRHRTNMQAQSSGV